MSAERTVLVTPEFVEVPGVERIIFNKALVVRQLVRAATELTSEALDNPGWQPHPCTIFNELARQLGVSDEFEELVARMPARLKKELEWRRAELR